MKTIEIEIREFRRGDEVTLYDIFYSAVHDIASDDYTPEQVNAWAPADMDVDAWQDRVRKNRPFLALRNGAVVAFADLQEDGYIDQFFVAAHASRQGVGNRLMSHILCVAKEKDLSQLTSDVSRTAEPFFRRFGFEVLERRLPVRRGVALPNARMRKRLLSGQMSECPGVNV